MSRTTTKSAMPGQQADSRAASTPARGWEVAGAGAKAPWQATPERIQARAYEIFRSRHGGPGDPASDWLQAEHELHGAVPGAAASVEVEAKTQARGEKLLASGQ